ncbi:hypothetical protein IU470_26900 [Nocardia abscessus]|uniref:Uncharacterized protein n=1 Tax=Nocardia abscessus TaxID=120957 RepID=A0ABS0CJX3_9NOCA|nr:hypothetical protein [Nocardia abscessus]MBF6228718.1 hypothetical protein [Nocardia abscessus]
MRRIATIGVYGFTAGAFLERLAGGGVGLLLDLRRHRGVRGADYSWANSARLQRALAAADTPTICATTSAIRSGVAAARNTRSAKSVRDNTSVGALPCAVSRCPAMSLPPS